jgi:hypothetical protein
VFIGGGLFGGLVGTRLAGLLSTGRGVLHIAFAGLIILVALYMAARTFTTFLQ